MDNAQKAIMIGVGLFITIIIISVVLLITNLGTGMVDDARDNLGNMSASLQNMIKSNYDNKTVTAADVKNMYIQYKDKMTVVIKTSVPYAKEATSLYQLPNTNIYEVSVPSGEIAGRTVYSVRTIPPGWSIDNLVNYNAMYQSYIIKKYNSDEIIGVYFVINK